MRTKRAKRLVLCGLLLFLACFQTGCGQLEIEDRAFPLALAVTSGKADWMYDFSFFFEEMDTGGSSLYHKEDTVVTAAGYPQAFTLFGRVQAAGLDDSHMQVILLSQELLADEDFLESFYPYFLKEHHFSWNTMVYLLDENSVSPKELRESTGGKIGTYLRDMAQSDEQEKTAGVPTLGDLYMEWNNRDQVLLLPVLAATTPPSVDHYVLLTKGSSGVPFSVDNARMLQLLRGNLKKMQLELSDGTIVRLENIRRYRAYSAPNGQRMATRDRPEKNREGTEPLCRMMLVIDCGLENRVDLPDAERETLMLESERLLRERLEQVEQWVSVMVGNGRHVIPEYEIKMSWMD